MTTGGWEEPPADRRRTPRWALVATIIAVVAAGGLLARVDGGDPPTLAIGGESEPPTPPSPSPEFGPPLGSWRLLPPAPIGARQHHSAVWTGEEMLVWGGVGWQPGEPVGAAYHPAADSWRALAPGPIGPRRQHVAVWTGEEMVVWGGQPATPEGTAELQAEPEGAAYDPATDTWRALPASPLHTRTFAAAAWADPGCDPTPCGELLVWGGARVEPGTPQGAAYNPATDTWRVLPDAPIGLHVRAEGIWTGRLFVVWGGLRGDRRSPAGAAYDPTTDAWQALPDAPIDPRVGHSIAWTGDAVLVWGGVPAGVADGATVAAIGARHPPGGDRWELLPDVPDSRTSRSAATTVWSEQGLVTWGGFDGRRRYADGLAWDPRPGRGWRPLADSLLSPRSLAAGVWTGDRMLVWGGFDGRGPLGDGAAFFPAAEQAVDRIGAWRGLPDGPLSGRRNHAMVWTGVEVLVWGGASGPRGEPTFLADGAAYFPTGERWQELPPAPVALGTPAAVWTGLEMFVWGPDDASRLRGAAYDPRGRTWRTLPDAPFGPAAFTFPRPVVAWTGEEFFVFAHPAPSTAPPLAAAAYRPSSDTWRSLPQPPMGSVTAAVWTGSRLLVLGNDTADFAADARAASYDPVGDAWLPLPAPPMSGSWDPLAVWAEGNDRLFAWGPVFGPVSEMPFLAYDPADRVWRRLASPPLRHTPDAVVAWTGQELVYFGQGHNNAAVYDPDADRWTPMAGGPLLSPRASAAGAWTGRELVIWGGSDQADGAAYEP